MATLLELAKIKHHAVRSDGAKFLDGVRNDSLNTSWLTVNSSGRVTLGPGLYDELLVVKGEVSDEQIKAWASTGAPFYDPSPVIQENQIPAAETWNKAVHDAQRALADAANARATADGKVTTFYQDTAPIAEALGDLWVHTGEGNKLYRWGGSSWEVVQDKKIQEAVQKAEDAQATADGKIVTFYQSTPPTATAVGDLWVDTDDNDRLYRWDGATWVDITDKSPVDAEKKPVYVKGAGADIDIDKYGIRATRKADGKKTFEIDAETGDAHFEGDGVFRGRVEASEGYFHGRVEAEEGYFRGDITGASGTFSGNLSAEKIIEGIEVYGGLSADHIKAGEISYDKLKVRFAKVTSALGGYYSDLLIPPTTLIEANSPDDWNLLIWAEGVSTFNRNTRLIIYHQSFDTLMGSIVLQFSDDGRVWSDQIDLAYSSASDNFEYTVGDRTFGIAPILVTNERVEMFVKFGEGAPRTPHLRFKRHAIA